MAGTLLFLLLTVKGARDGDDQRLSVDTAYLYSFGGAGSGSWMLPGMPIKGNSLRSGW